MVRPPRRAYVPKRRTMRYRQRQAIGRLESDHCDAARDKLACRALAIAACCAISQSATVAWSMLCPSLTLQCRAHKCVILVTPDIAYVPKPRTMRYRQRQAIGRLESDHCDAARDKLACRALAIAACRAISQSATVAWSMLCPSLTLQCRAHKCVTLVTPDIAKNGRERPTPHL